MSGADQTPFDAEAALARLIAATIIALHKPVDEVMRSREFHDAPAEKRKFMVGLLIEANDRLGLWLRSQR